MATKKNELEEAKTAPVEQQPLDAVIVVKVVDDDGAISTKVMTNGAVQVTEVQTLLELGVRGWREQIGLTP